MQVTSFELDMSKLLLRLSGPVTPWASITADFSTAWDFQVYDRSESSWTPSSMTELPIFLRTHHPTLTTGNIRHWTAMITKITETKTDQGETDFTLFGAATLNSYEGSKALTFSKCEDLQVYATGKRVNAFCHFSELADLHRRKPTKPSLMQDQ